MSRFVGKTTIAGRVVYDRKLHPFKSQDALRIVRAVANVDTGEPEGDPLHWRAIARYALNAFLILDPVFFYEDQIFRPKVEANPKTGERSMPQEFYIAAAFVHYVQEISNIIDRIAPYLPFIKTVWDIGGPLLQQTAKGAANSLGSWEWSNALDRAIFY